MGEGEHESGSAARTGSTTADVVVRAELGAVPLWNRDGGNLDPASLRLSGRLLVALADWADFYDDVGGEISDADVLGEFVGQGYKLAHALRRELKGRRVWFHDPDLDALVEIERRRPR